MQASAHASIDATTMQHTHTLRVQLPVHVCDTTGAGGGDSESMTGRVEGRGGEGRGCCCWVLGSGACVCSVVRTGVLSCLSVECRVSVVCVPVRCRTDTLGSRVHLTHDDTHSHSRVHIAIDTSIGATERGLRSRNLIYK